MQTDTLQIECFKRGLNNTDSLIKTYTYSNNSEFLNKYSVLNSYRADKIKIKLYASVFPDRALIKDLIFIPAK